MNRQTTTAFTEANETRNYKITNMKPEKKFNRDGLTYSRLRQSDDLAAYVVALDSKILYYLIMRIKNGELIFNDEHEIRSLSVLGHQWDIVKRKIENSNH